MPGDLYIRGKFFDLRMAAVVPDGRGSLCCRKAGEKIIRLLWTQGDGEVDRASWLGEGTSLWVLGNDGAETTKPW